MFRLFRRNRERGASAVEFAIVLPLLLMLVFGIMETGWLFAQTIEVRNAAREGARLAVVNHADAGTMRSEVCSRAVLSADRAKVGFTLNADTAEVVVEQTYASLTGFLPFFDAIPITSTVEMRLEQPIDAWGTSGLAGCS